MTQIAPHLEMLALQLECALLMRFAREQRRFEVHFVVACAAIRTGGSSFELAAMDIFMAIAA